MSTQPTDAELKALWRIHAADIGGSIYYARAVLAKWGTPAPVGVGPVAYVDVAQSKSKMSMTWWPEPAGFSLPNGRYPLYTTPQPTQPQAGAVPLDEARRLFDAGWKAAALFCDREDVVADGIIGFGACPQFEAAFSAAHGSKGGQHGTE